MTPGYSKLFLNESVIPDENCPALFAAHDMNMMAILAGIKRSRSQWIDLLHSVGFEDVSVWTSPHPGEEDGIIEAAIPAK